MELQKERTADTGDGWFRTVALPVLGFWQVIRSRNVYENEDSRSLVTSALYTEPNRFS